MERLLICLNNSLMAKKNKSALCPCGQGEFDQCCGRYLSGQAFPDMPEALMRSRYTAFVLKDEPYLRLTWHPDHVPSTPLFDGSDTTKWLRLSVIQSQMTDDMHGQVEFIAYYKIQGRAYQLHEISRFTQIPLTNTPHLHWVYVDGDIQD